MLRNNVAFSKVNAYPALLFGSHSFASLFVQFHWKGTPLSIASSSACPFPVSFYATVHSCRSSCSRESPSALTKRIGVAADRSESSIQEATCGVALHVCPMLTLKLIVTLSAIVYAQSAPMYNQTFSPWTVMGPVRHNVPHPHGFMLEPLHRTMHRH